MRPSFANDDFGTPRLDAFYAQAVCEFDRRHVPELDPGLQQEFVASLVRKAVESLTVEDVGQIVAEQPTLLLRPVDPACFAGGAVTPFACLQLILADELDVRLSERARLLAA